MSLNRLYNLDESRTEVYNQTFVVPEDTRRVYLDYLPKAGTLVVQKIIPGAEALTYIIVSNQEPKPGEVYFEYRDQYDYVAAKGVLIFSKTEVVEDYTFKTHYVPVASRIDANVINYLIDHYNNFDGNIYSKTDFLNKTNIVAWTAIKDRPDIATTSKAGLISSSDKAKLDSIPANALMGGLTFKPESSSVTTDYVPMTSGSTVVLQTEDTLATKTLDTNKVSIGVNTTILRDRLNLPIGTTNALAGTAGTPSSTNKFVTNEDTRLSNTRDPNPHTHSITCITGLEEKFNNYALADHSHTLDEIQGWSAEDLRGEDGKTTNIEFTTVKMIGHDDAPYIINTNKVGGYPDIYNQKLEVGIPKPQDGNVAWEDLTEEQRQSLRGDTGASGMPATVLVPADHVHSGAPGSEVIITPSGPTIVKIGNVNYSATTLDMTIPKGIQGDVGMSGAFEPGVTTTTSYNTNASVTVDDPVTKQIGDKLYSVQKVNFTLPRGPKGSAKSDALEFTEGTDSTKYHDWSGPDEDGNYTLTIPVVGVIPTSRAFKQLSAGTFAEVVATIKFDYNNVYIISNHKFSGIIYVEGLASATGA